jgi:putative hydroxymethylpyrimidine transport system substrate-binding protein
MLISLTSAAVAVGGCGASTATAPRTQTATLVLDFTPNAIHAGIYSAIARADDVDAGVRLHVVAPPASTDSLKLLESGRASFAVLDIHDLAIARERGEDIVGIMAIVEHPLAALIAAPGIADPRALEGRTVGISGVPSDTAVLHSIIAGAGGDPSKVKTVTIGFNAVEALLSGRVSAAIAFWNDEGVTLQQHRRGFHVFRVDRYGAPAYPELILCARGGTLRRDPALARSVVRALTRGYDATVADPAASARELESSVPGLDPKLVSAELAVEVPAFRAADGRVGELDPRVLAAWARWEARFGIVSRPPDVGAMFDSQFLPGP